MPRILYVTDGVSPWVIGGMQVVSRRHLGWLTDAGYDVIVLTGRGWTPKEVDFASQLIELPYSETSYLQKLNPWTYSNQLRNFSKSVNDVVQEVRPEVIYSEGPLVDAYLSRKRSERLPVIFHPHGLEMFQKTGSRLLDARLRPMRSLIKDHVTRADFTISQGGHLDDILIRVADASTEKIVYLPNCKPSGFKIVTAARQRQRGRFLFVGRNEIRKGLPQLLSAIKNVPGAILHIVGETDRTTLSQQGVIFHGPIHDREKLSAVFEQADFLVTPSFAEGMPTVILEAFCSALPVIATDVGAIPILVRDGNSGFLIPSGDRSALVSALRRAIALADQDYQRMSTNALALATTEFSTVNVRCRFLKIVQDALQLSNGAREGNLASKQTMSIITL